MAARLRKRHDEQARSKIKTSQLINRLQNHIDGEVKLETSQVRGIEVLLRKTIPDLKATELTGELDLNHKIEFKI